ncbi:velvet factor-domain-containing protein [Pholiota molesta]|nr:velvet factor-domain-containing protein [Pholiota molesta]
MIQRTDIRQPSIQATAIRQDTPEVWGQWSGRRHYSLEVVQHPLRARMCGFGDKDRRPLAPAAVAKMIVRRDDDTIVDVDEVDCSFFLVTVDLWSADGKHEMNLVLHPSSTDRYVPSHASKSKRKAATGGGGRTTPTPSHYRPGDQTGHSTPSLSAHAPYGNQTYFSPHTSSDNLANYSQSTPYGAPAADPTSSWGYSPQLPSSGVDRSTSFPPPILPSIHSFGRTTSSSSTDAGSATASHSVWASEAPAPPEPEILPYRAWNTDTAYAPVDVHSSSIDPALRAPAEQQQQRDGGWASASYSNAPVGAEDPSGAAVYPYQQGPYAQYPPQASVAPGTPVPTHVPATVPPLPRHTYTRTLVGPLSANACRLLDEHRKPGIFFLFQDLSVRTEGSFRLRMRLMNVGAPPAPEMGSQRVHNDVSPVLAQTFTEQFTVFSAKRFPGVPDTTALSIAFGNQGQNFLCEIGMARASADGGAIPSRTRIRTRHNSASHCGCIARAPPLFTSILCIPSASSLFRLCTSLVRSLLLYITQCCISSSS